MVLPLIWGIAAVAAGITGVGSGINGAMKMSDAKNTLEIAKSRHAKNILKFEESNKKTSIFLDQVGIQELQTLESFDRFIDVFEKIHNKPEFKNINIEGVDLPQYEAEKIRETSVGAAILLGGIGGAAAGTAGGFAAASAGSAAVMALASASTGTAISTLSGVAATNATLAAIGGGSLAAGGGGMALGSKLLGGATLGMGLLVGGIIFNITGNNLSEKSDEAHAQMIVAEKEINKICEYLESLYNHSKAFHESLLNANSLYIKYLEKLAHVVEVEGKNDWDLFSEDEKLLTENTVLLVTVLYNMCKVKLVKVSETEAEANTVNVVEIQDAIDTTDNAVAGLI